MLEKIITGKRAKARQIVLYGTDGIGKSTWAASAPSPLFLDIEDGCNDIGCDRTPLITDIAQFNEMCSAIISEPNDYQTIVIDSADWLERLIHKGIARKAGEASIVDIGYGKGYKLALEGWAFVLSALNEMRRLGKTVIILAHSKVERFSPPDGDPYDRYELALHKSAAPVIREWADEVLFANYAIDTIREQGDFGRERVKAVGGRRVVHTCESPTHMAKRRLKMPDVLPLEWDAYAQHLPGADAKKQGNIQGIVKNGTSKKEKVTNG